MGKLFRCSAVALLLAATPAGADTFRFGGATLELPDGWTVKTAGRMATLTSPGGQGFVEVYQFSAVPKADKDVIAEKLKPRRGTTDVKVETAEEHQQNGLTGVRAEGTARVKDTPVKWRIVCVPVGQRAVLAASFVNETDAARLDETFAKVLASLK